MSSNLFPPLDDDEMIEVERKFVVPLDIASKVLQLGGTQIGSITFTDTYYEEALAARDIWLRERTTNDESCWELKVPASTTRIKSGGETTAFTEIIGPEQIVDALNRNNYKFTAGSLSDLPPFATLTTTRRKFNLDDVSIDCDEADFDGFAGVMELEVLVSSDVEIAGARASIAAVAEKLNATDVGNTGGKLESFIRLKKPTLLATLIENGVLN